MNQTCRDCLSGAEAMRVLLLNSERADSPEITQSYDSILVGTNANRDEMKEKRGGGGGKGKRNAKTRRKVV